MLTPATLPAIQSALRAAELDGWLLYDFRGTNPVAASLLGFHGMVTRRIFAWIPAEGTPVAVTHAIEQGTPLPVLQKLLGHSHLETTSIYTHCLPELVTSNPSPLDALAGPTVLQFPSPAQARIRTA